MDKISVKQAIIVEGKYDKIKLSSIVDATIIVSNGFRIFKDKEKIELIKVLAKKDGIIIMTDSDVAGFKLRNFIRSCVKDANVVNIYIPQIEGKEKRKISASKEGYLGVEGINADIIRELFSKAGILEAAPIINPITKEDFYNNGLIGMENSHEKRIMLLKSLNLPNYLSTKSLLDIINRLMTKDEFMNFIDKELL